jgi:hypothetical protein
MSKKELWSCPECGEKFTTANQWHSCGHFSLEALFVRCEPHVPALFDRFRAVVEACGPVTVIPQKTRVAFQVEMRFAALMPQKHCLRGHLVLAEPHPAACFERVETFSPRNHLHVFRLTRPEDLTPELRRWIAVAYRVGCRDHLRGAAPDVREPPDGQE